jgi:hypothetical protein
MDALRNTINTQSIKTKQIVFQYPDGSFPEPGAVLNITDIHGHTDWTREPNLDSITLVDGSGNTGVVSYTDDDGLLVNGLPVGGGGGGTVIGGTNITITGGGSTVNFDPTKGGGVNMLKYPLTNADSISMGRTADTVNPQLQMNVPAGSGTGTITFTDGTNIADVSYSGLVNRLTATGDNIAIYTPSSNQLIEMGSILGKLQVSTQDQQIALRRYIAGGGAIDTSVTLEANGIVQIGDSTSTTKPTVYFQGNAPTYAQIEFDNATSQLTISGSSGGVTSTKIATPLCDVATNTAGAAGQVYTSQGAGMPPIWASTSGPIVFLQSKTYTTVGTSSININNAEFSALPSVGVSTVTFQVVLQAGGGGGGGGLGIGFPSAGGTMTSGGGGGGGAGYSQTLTQTLNYNASCTLTVGGGGAGGGGAQILLGSFDAGAGTSGGTTQVVTPAGTYSVVGGGGGGGGSGTGGAQAGGAGSSPGYSGSFNFSGPGSSFGDDGAGIVFGGAGGGTYGGVGGTSAGGSYGSPDGAATNMAGGQGLGGAPAYSGAGGGGGSGGAGGYGQNGGAGAPGYIQINIISFT